MAGLRAKMSMDTLRSFAALPAARVRVRAWLVHPRLPLVAGLLAAVLTLPSLTVGWVGDDLWHRTVLKG